MMILQEKMFLDQVYHFGAILLFHSQFFGWVSLQQENHTQCNQLAGGSHGVNLPRGPGA